MKPWIERKQYTDKGETHKRFNSLTYDSDFQRDRARIIHSAAFRRLQTKTQILGIGENDFYRTRLTHSIEVAQIGSGICEMLRERHSSNSEYSDWMPSFCAIESICLCHDIGHPPFGHGGEVALNYSMAKHGGFEGNGQTLRIVSKLGEYSPNHGLDLTRRTMLGLLKYPALYSSLKNDQDFPEEADSVNLDSWKPPKCILDTEEDILSWILSPFGKDDVDEFTMFSKESNKNGNTKYKSFDTTIMDVADDISYAIHDFEDAIALKLIDRECWTERIEPILKKYPDNQIYIDVEKYRHRLFSKSNKERKHAISKLVDYFIGEVEVIEYKQFNHPLLRLQARMKEPAATILDGIMCMVREIVILSPEVQTLEYKGQQLVVRLFDVLSKNPKRLLPETTFKQLEAENGDKRVICDYISGMTDVYATKIYHKLFSPSMGSVFDRL